MIFHLAIPSRDLDESKEFYRKLGAFVGREYKTHIVLSFHDHQLVCHKSDEWDKSPKMYPRHFGIVIGKEYTLINLWAKYRDTPLVFEPYFIRHKNEVAEHHTFFLKDPSNNLVEFKWYKNRSSIFA